MLSTIRRRITLFWANRKLSQIVFFVLLKLKIKKQENFSLIWIEDRKSKLFLDFCLAFDLNWGVVKFKSHVPYFYIGVWKSIHFYDFPPFSWNVCLYSRGICRGESHCAFSSNLCHKRYNSKTHWPSEWTRRYKM